MSYIENFKNHILRIAYAGIIILLTLLIHGCTLRTPSMNKLDSLTFSANLKADADSNYGKKAAYFNGRIYYLSSELGAPGIYSMNPAGEEIRLEIPVEDIRTISVQEDGIYYSGFAGIQQNINGPYRQFQMFIKSNGFANVVAYLENTSFHDNSLDNNVWDFYIGTNKTIVIRFIDCSDSSGEPWLSVVTIQNKQTVAVAQYITVENSSTSAQTKTNDALLNLSSFRDFCYLSLYSMQTKNPSDDRLIGYRSISVYDSLRHQVAFPIDRLFSDSCSYLTVDFNRDFCRNTEDTIIFSSVKGLESYDKIQRKSSELLTLSSPEFLFQTIDLGNDILIFTERLRANYWLDEIADKVFRQNRAVQETLYHFDPDTSEIVRLLHVGRNNAFLYADAKTAVTGGGKKISIYDISGDTAILQRTIEIEHNIVDRANKVDTAGSWLFLYRFNEKTQRDELIEKVYIGS